MSDLVAVSEKEIEEISDLKNFDRLGYFFSPEQSDKSTYVFLTNHP